MKRAVAGIVLYGDKVLIGKKIIKEGHFVSGGWHIPGGHIHNNETIEDAIVREIKEETQLAIHVKRKLCDHIISSNDIVISWFICTTNTDCAVAGDDLSEVKFVDKNRVAEECDFRAIQYWPGEVLEFLSS